MPYYAGSTLLFFLASLGGWALKTPRLGVVIGLIPMIALALGRGLVGADTAVYLQSIGQIIENGGYSGLFEPVFEYLVLFISFFLSSEKLILIALGALITGILLRALYGRVDPFIFCIFIVPVYYFDMVMNGIRYGLAFSLVLLASHYLVQERPKVFFGLVGLASLFQISGGLLGFLLYFIHIRRWKWVFWIGVVGAAGMFVAMDYILAKFQSYSDIQTTSALSGLSTLIVCVLMLFVWIMDPECRKGSKLAVLFLLMLSLMMFGLCQISYAGVRLLQLVNFLIILYFSVCLTSGSARLSSVSKVCLVLVAVIAVMFRLKNFADGAGVGPSPFVPYLFFWE